MAKTKTKAVGFGGNNLATEIRQGVWQFTIGNWTWRRYDRLGINTFVLKVRDAAKPDVFDEVPMFYSKDIKEAGLFAEGFHAGVAWDKIQHISEEGSDEAE